MGPDDIRAHPLFLMTLGEFIQQTARRLALVSNTPLLDTQVLAAQILDQSRAWVLAHPEYRLHSAQLRSLRSATNRLESGEPLPYVLGHWEFFGLDFRLTPDVLIPRPETELLVERALAWLGEHPHACRVVDVGTGSGCIAISLAVHAPCLQLMATDRSSQALAVAQENASYHEVQNQILFLQADLLPDQAGPFDLICANLPYIPTVVLGGLDVSHHEPRLALDGGPDGLDLIRRLLLAVPSLLAEGGLALLEIEASQGEAAVELARTAVPEAEPSLIQDLAGHDRILQVSVPKHRSVQ